ncbi:transposase [Candidatus Gottesmanbacteria bacterium]|nr:transposase [Candidatus Gottesmanbacteria bacterium]
MTTYRNLVFANDHYYHVFNRGVERRSIFTNKREYDRAMQTLRFYRFADPQFRLSKYLSLPHEKRISFMTQLEERNNTLIDIVCFSFMPNHFHFLLRQKIDHGIKKFISNFSNSYSKYFNTKHKRVGPLLQGIFKALHVETNEQLLHLSRYIHLNPVTSSLITIEEMDTYPYSSFPEYLGIVNNKICAPAIVLSQFSSVNDYKRFVYDHIDYAKELETIKHLILDD